MTAQIVVMNTGGIALASDSAVTIMLRLFTHFGVFVVSPILFLIAIPVLNKNGLLEYIEK